MKRGAVEDFPLSKGLKRNKITQNGNKTEYSTAYKDGTKISTPVRENDVSIPLRTRRQKSTNVKIAVDPHKDVEVRNEISSPDDKSVYTTPKTTNSIYETPPGFPQGSTSYEDDLDSLKTSIVGSHASVETNDGIVSAQSQSNLIIKDELNNQVDASDDEAPEVVSKETAREKVRQIDMEAAKASRSQAHADKLKRREKDSRLKQQAETAKRRRRKDLSSDGALDKNNTTNEPNEEIAYTDKGKRKLPKYLPQEVIAMEIEKSMQNSATEPTHDDQEQQIRKKRVYMPEEKRPKDLRRGKIKVRIMHKENELLPPKGNRQSRSIREAWIRGQHGRRGETTFARREVRRSFLMG